MFSPSPRTLLAGVLLILFAMTPPLRQAVTPVTLELQLQAQALLEGRPLKGLPPAQLSSLQASLEQRVLQLRLQQLQSTDMALNPALDEQNESLQRQLVQTRQELLWTRLGEHPFLLGWLVFGGVLGLMALRRQPPDAPPAPAKHPEGSELNSGPTLPRHADSNPGLDPYPFSLMGVESGSALLNSGANEPWAQPSPLAPASAPAASPRLMFIEAHPETMERETAIPATDHEGLPISLDLPTFDPETLAAALLHPPAAASPLPAWTTLLSRALTLSELDAVLNSCTQQLSLGQDYDYASLLGLLSHQLAMRDGQRLEILPLTGPRVSGAARIRFIVGDALSGAVMEELSGLPAGHYPRLVAALSDRLGFDGRGLRLMVPGLRGYQIQSLRLDDAGLSLEVIASCPLPLA